MEKNPITCIHTDSSSSSPEFEFWMVRNPSFPQPQLHTADQLFDRGVILPLHHLPNQPLPKSSDPLPEPDPEPEPEPPPEPPTSGPSSSKRWKDIFRKVEKKPSPIAGNEDEPAVGEDKDQELKKKKGAAEKNKKLTKKDRKSSSSSSATASAAASTDLNINIWPFSRSRSAGTGGGRGKASPSPAASRKVSSAPCSRSNSRGESSKPRKWPTSPGRPGLHLGRSSPVWQVRRGVSGVKPSSETPVPVRSAAGAPKEGSNIGRRSTNGNGGHARVLNLNVPLCIGYRHHLSCRTDENGGPGSVSVDGSGQSSSSGGNSSSNVNSNGNATLFNLRTLFSKKVY